MARVGAAKEIYAFALFVAPRLLAEERYLGT